MFRKQFNLSSILLIIAGNVYCIWYYINHPNDFASIVWIYWFQSIIIGFFNFLDLLTIKNYDASDLKMNGKPVTSDNKGCVAWFFLIHFGIFHFVYAVFLLVLFGIQSIDKLVLILGVSVFLLESIMNYIRQKKLERDLQFNIGTLFFLPYLRIIPMHMMILLPAFFGWKPSLLFLVLKMGADLLSYFIYMHLSVKKNAELN